MPVRIVFILSCAVACAVAQTPAPSPSGAAAKVSLPPAAPTESSLPPIVEQKTQIAPKPAASADDLPATARENRPPAGKNKATKDQAESSDHKAYVFGANDIVIIKIWNQPNLSGAFPIGSDGLLSIPAVGEIKA